MPHDNCHHNHHHHHLSTGKVVLVGRVLAGCCLLTVAIVAWAQYVGYADNLQQQQQHRLDGGGTGGVVSSLWERTNSKDNTIVTNGSPFSCHIGGLQLHLPRAFPDLIIAGAAKSGTTSLASWLLDHPKVLSPKNFECHFFNTGIHPREMEPLLLNQKTSLINSDSNSSTDGTTTNAPTTTSSSRDELICQLRKRYLRHWPDLLTSLVTTRPGESLVGDQDQTAVYSWQHEIHFTFDKTPDYLYPSRIPAVIRALLFETAAPSETRPKIVVLLRNPIDRAYSHYRMGQRMMREEHVSFETFIEREINLLLELGLTDFSIDDDDDNNHDDTMVSQSVGANKRKEFPVEELDDLYDQVSDQLKGHNYLTRGLYAMQLERWFRHGLGDNLLVLPYPWLTSQPSEVYAQVLQFVGMPPHKVSHEVLNKRFNYNHAVTEPLGNSTRTMLQRFFESSNQDLVDLFQQHNHSQHYDWQTLGTF